MTGDRGRKIVAAREATKAAIDAISDDVLFAVVAGTQGATIVYPPAVGLARADGRSRHEAKEAVDRVQARGGTAIGTWLMATLQLVEMAPAGSVAHCILLTDGKNESESDENLQSAINACVGRFQCDARGLGTDWEVDELRRVASALLGTVDIVPESHLLADEFRSLTEAAMGKQVGSVRAAAVEPEGLRSRVRQAGGAGHRRPHRQGRAGQRPHEGLPAGLVERR